MKNLYYIEVFYKSRCMHRPSQGRILDMYGAEICPISPPTKRTMKLPRPPSSLPLMRGAPETLSPTPYFHPTSAPSQFLSMSWALLIRVQSINTNITIIQKNIHTEIILRRQSWPLNHCFVHPSVLTFFSHQRRMGGVLGFYIWWWNIRGLKKHVLRVKHVKVQLPAL